eukprot:231900-Prymnesium_polylepis.1
MCVCTRKNPSPRRLCRKGWDGRDGEREYETSQPGSVWKRSGHVTHHTSHITHEILGQNMLATAKGLAPKR